MSRSLLDAHFDLIVAGSGSIGSIAAIAAARYYNGPAISRTRHKTGVIKVASGERRTSRERQVVEAAVAVHRRTGAPILTHTAGLRAAAQSLH